MKTIFIILMVTFASHAFAQKEEVPRFSRVSVPKCDCSVYMPNGSPEFDQAYSEDSSIVFTSEYKTNGGFTFSVIAVRFKTPIGSDKTVNEDLLISYMEYIKFQLGISVSVGYGKGHTMDSNPNAVGVIDYCEDNNGFQYAMKGWIDGDKLAVLIINGPGGYPYFNAQQMFFDGFRFTN